MYSKLLQETLAPLRVHESHYGVDFRSSITSAAILFEGLLSRASVEPVPPELEPVDFERLALVMSQGIAQYLSDSTAPLIALEELVAEMRHLLDRWNESSLSAEEIREYRAVLGEIPR